jgi:hypothetical protein
MLENTASVVKPRIYSARQIRAFLKPALGKRCWHVSVGGCTLPTFSLALGAKRKRERALENRRQPPAFRKNEPEVAFFVWCTWRLDSKDCVIVSSDGSGAEIEDGLGQLVGLRLTGLRVRPPAWDLSLQFGDDLQLMIFSDHAGRRPSFDGNWEAIFLRRGLYVGPGGKVESDETPRV